MSVKLLLSIILFILMFFIGGSRGIKSFFTLYLNFIILFVIIILIAYNFDPIIVSLVGCLIISVVMLFFINGVNQKTITAFISVIITLLILLLIIYKVGDTFKVQGFSDEEFDAISPYNLYIHTNFIKVTISVILLGLIGAVVDASISISSAMNEILLHNPNIKQKELFLSGINIGKDIIGTTTNTLYFAYIGGFIALLIWFNELNYSLVKIINSKVFVDEIIQILFSGIGAIMIIPITAYVSSKYYLKIRTIKGGIYD
jgi:uncharacterized membrane protein